MADPLFRTDPNYADPGTVVDPEPRTISNLIVDQTENNPAAVAAAAENPFSASIISPGLDGILGTDDDRQVFFIPNTTPDVGLSAPFNAWMTFFGQFFDHGLDLVTKSGSGFVFIPLQPDDPLIAGADGILATPTTCHEDRQFMVVSRAARLTPMMTRAENTTTPFVDQNQTYTSHPSHQVFFRAYEMDVNGAPVATGRLITNRDLGADGKFGTGDDVEIGGMATWKVLKAQARDILGINLTDADFDNVPLLATDAYGNFIKGDHGFPLVVMRGGRRHFGRAEDGPTCGRQWRQRISLANAMRTGHQFLIDVAHDADAGEHFDGPADSGRRQHRQFRHRRRPAFTTTNCLTPTTWPATAA